MDMDMDTGIVLGIIGIALTICFGVWGTRAIKKRSLRQLQKQIADNGAVAIQSGRDTSISAKNE